MSVRPPTKLILDANLAVVLIVGLTNKDYVLEHKRTKSDYTKRDFELIEGIIARSSGLIFSPNVLTETSNLLRQTTPGPIKDEVAITLKTLLDKANKGVTETFVESNRAAMRIEYMRLGLTDAVLLEIAESGATLLTSDNDLYLAAERAKLKVIHYGHYKRLPDLDI